MLAELTQLVALSPPKLSDVNATARRVCAETIGLSPLSVETPGHADPAVTEFAEQFSADVASLTDGQREAFTAAMGRNTFRAVVLVFIADFVPRIQVGLASLGVAWPSDGVDWDHGTDPVELLLNGFAPAVGQMCELDPVTSEIVRLRGARQHNCRMCKSLREGAALDSGGTESMYADIDRYESSDLSERHKAALRYANALIWTPAQADGSGLSAHFSRAQAVELTLDVMRNACNKIMVALGADAARVSEGTERYLLGADGQPVYS